jgi:S-adenosylmethionine hydrolase
VPVITLSTDFGWDDPYLGIMKGVILGINPRVTLVDITHGLSPHRLLEAAFKLGTTAEYFPKGTIHLAVVDPGVGGVRRPIMIKTQDHIWIGPDNGLFTRIVQLFPGFRVFHLNNPKYFLNPVSHTFHGRDIFAPVAAHVSHGISLAALGNLISDPVLLDLPEATAQKDSLIGQVLYADRFGNLITNLNRELVKPYGDLSDLLIRIGSLRLRGLRISYAQAKPGELLALFGSNDSLEIACNLGSAAEMVGYVPGKFLKVIVNTGGGGNT